MLTILLLAGAESIGFLHSVKGDVRLNNKPIHGLVRVVAESKVAVAKGGAVIFVSRKTGNRWQLSGPYSGQGVADGLKTIAGRPAPLKPLTAMSKSTDRGFSTTAGPIMRPGEHSIFTHLWPVGTIRPTACTVMWAGKFRADAFRVRVIGGQDEELWESTLPREARQIAIPAKVLEPGTTVRLAITALNDGEPDGDAEQVVKILDADSLKVIQTMEEKQGASIAWAECLESCGLISEAAATYAAAGDKENAARLRSKGELKR